MPLDIYDARNGLPEERGGRAVPRRPHISILFECCGVYARIYRHPDKPCYEGRCPKCLRLLHVRVGPEGTSERFFRAY